MIGICALKKELAEQYAARHFIPSERWFYVPVSDKLLGVECDSRRRTHD